MRQAPITGDVKAGDPWTVRGRRAVRCSTFSPRTADGSARFVEDRRRHPVKVPAPGRLDRDEALSPRLSLPDGAEATVFREGPTLPPGGPPSDPRRGT